jgi:hypothetical protein
MRHILFLIFFAIVLLLLPQIAHAQVPFVEQVAARCKGEAAFAVSECACTVHNRLSGGWSEHNVLIAYFAEDVTPTEFDIWVTAHVLKNGCREDLWFMFSSQDVAKLGLDYVLPLLTVRSEEGKVVRFYAKDALDQGQ